MSTGAQSDPGAQDVQALHSGTPSLGVHRQLHDACYVRALYPFSSDEPRSLSFDQGDLIRVLSKLDSGWWDGLLRGRRGWFPSNYVEEVEVVSSEDEAEDPIDKNGSAPAEAESYEPWMSATDLSSQNRETTVVDDDGSSEEAAFWIPHATSEGRVYFFNTMTGATTWDIPYLPLSIVERSKTIAKREAPITTGMRPPPEDAVEVDLQTISHEPTCEIYDSMYSKGSHTPQMPLSPGVWRDIHENDILDEDDFGAGEEDEEEDGEILLFAMPKTSATEINSPEICVPPTDNDRVRDRNGAQGTIGLGVSVSSNPPASWLADVDLNGVTSQADELSAVYREWTRQISKTIESLSLHVNFQGKAEYETICDQLKNIVSSMLQSLGLIREYSISVLAETSGHDASDWRDASNSVWKVQYRQIVAATSQVLLSAHIAGNHWASQDCANRMLQDAVNLASTVDKFLLDIWETPSTMVSLKSFAIADRSIGGGWQGNGIHGVSSHAVVNTTDLPGKITLCASSVLNLENLATSVNERSKTCRSKLRIFEQDPKTHSSTVILRDIQGITDELMQVLQYCEQFDLSALDGPIQAERSPTLTDFSKSKQLVYDAVGSLILSAQSITLPEDTLHGLSENITSIAELRKALALLDAALQSTILHAEFMVQELQGRRFSQTHSPEATGLPRRDEKTKQFFGSDAPEMAMTPVKQAVTIQAPASNPRSFVTNGLQQTQTPWFLENELESDLSYDYKGNVKAGTLLALVERLTRHDLLDSMYNNTFLLTYRSFTTAEELSSLLMQRFLIEPPPGLTPQQLEIWVEVKLNPIRLRVFNVLKSWIENFFMEPPVDATREWLKKMQNFAETVISEHISATPILLKLIEKRIHQGGVPVKKMVPNTMTSAPPPILPRNLRKMRLLDLDPLEVARQLTIMESTLYNKIKPTECLDKSWSKPDAAEGAENIKAMILRSNQITAWVAEAILYQTDLKKRVSLIKHFVHIAEKCRALHNFSTLTAIISGLNSAPIHRLRRTWDLLNARVAMSAEDLNRLMNSSKNFSQYREALHQMQPPCVPFLGVYLTDLTFIEDGNPNMSVKARHLINISKRQKTAEVIRDIQQYQALPYALTVVPEIQDYIRSCMDITRDISELYDISLEREPREREDEKIARLLQESGFL